MVGINSTPSYAQMALVFVLLGMSAVSDAHVIYGGPLDQGYPPPPPGHHPVMRYELPPPPLQPPLPPPPQLIYRGPDLWLLPPPLRGVFPPFVERIVQRIQTYWSVYNPPEVLTRPPPPLIPTTNKPRKKVTTVQPSSSATTAATTAETTPPDAETTTAAITTAPGAEDEASTGGGVATLAVLEVTPAEPRPLVDEHEPPMYLTAERASLLRDRDAFLRLLRERRPLALHRPDGLDAPTDYADAENAMNEDQ